MENSFDSIIIGFGKAGKTLATHLAQKGERVALCEKSDKMYGGTCINVGCIPSKSLVNSAAVSASHPDEGFEAKARRYAAAIEEKRRVTSMLRKKNFDKLNDNPRVTVLNGAARFTAPNAVEVSSAQGVQTLTADKIFINTGSASVVPDLAGIEGNPHVFYSDTLMELEALPRKLVIVGAGYIGLEFASMYAAFGAQVLVLQDSAVFLPREDADISGAIQRSLEAQGVEFRFSAKIDEIGGDGTVRYTWQTERCAHQSDAVLLATGRRPNTDGLGLDAAGIETTSRGAVSVDEHLRTNQPGVWAMGDVAGGLQFTYVSLDDYRVVVSALDGGAYTTAKRKNVPYSVFMATPFSRVGLSEAQAREAGLDVKVSVLSAAAIPKAQVLQKTDGMLKAVVDAHSGKILGAALLCAESYEMINTVKLAMDLDAPYTQLRDQVFTHPTMSEALNDLFTIS